jgi:hypothetical protein
MELEDGDKEGYWWQSKIKMRLLRLEK